MHGEISSPHHTWAEYSAILRTNSEAAITFLHPSKSSLLETNPEHSSYFFFFFLHIAVG